MDKSEYGHTESYRVATTTEIRDRAPPADGRHGRRVNGPKPKDEPKKELSELKSELGMDEHVIPLPELQNRLGVSPDALGLDDDEVVETYMRDGPNILTTPKTDTEPKKYLKIVFSGLNLVLWLCVFLCMIVFGTHAARVEQPEYDFLHLGVLLVCYILITSVFTYFMDTKSARLMASLDNSMPRTAEVYRGSEMMTWAEEVVVGDIVMLKPGMIVPADVRILKADGLKVDNSSLTGDPTPLSRSADSTHEDPLETRNLAFAATVVVEGTGEGLVIHTGDRTIVGKMTKLASEIGIKETLLATELKAFTKSILQACLLLGGFLFVLTLIIGYEWNEAVAFLIGVLLANIPLALPAVLTVALIVVSKRMASIQCLPMHLNAAHALGRVNCMIIDKVGTCTEGTPKTSHIWIDGKSHLPDDGSIPGTNSTYPLLMRSACLCNPAYFRPDQLDLPVHERDVMGDATDAAILRSMEVAFDGNRRSYMEKFQEVFSLPYDSVHKVQICVHAMSGDERHLLTAYGAADRVIARCSTMSHNGRSAEMSSAWREKIEKAYEELAGLGEKVVGFADVILPADRYPRGFKFDSEGVNVPMNQWRFLGLMSFVDPAKPHVIEAIRKAREAGIKVMLATDDHPITAREVAKQLGIFSFTSETVEQLAARLGKTPSEINPRAAPAAVVLGTNLAAMEAPQLESVLLTHKEIVFSRITSMQKLEIVEACQRLGVVVAATGKGIADLGTLIQADIGVALGGCSTDASKQASDVVLLDDNFNSLVRGIEESRYAFENIRKSVIYMMASNFPQIVAFVAYVVFDLPFPLGIMNVLLIDLVTDMLPSISLLYENPEEFSMYPYVHEGQSLGDSESFELSYGQIGIIQAAAGSFCYFVMMAENGWWIPYLIGNRNAWYSRGANDLIDRYNQEWTYTQRMSLERMAHAGVFQTIVACQIMTVLCVKTRKLSIFQSPRRNLRMWIGIIIALGVVAIVNYIPVINRSLSLGTVYYQPWVIPIPFVVIIFVYEEIRKLFLRQRGASRIIF